MCVAGDIRQAFAHDRDDVVGQVEVDATVELVDDDELVVQVRVDGAAVECDEQRRGEAQDGTRERRFAADSLHQADGLVAFAQVVHDRADLTHGLVDRCEG